MGDRQAYQNLAIYAFPMEDHVQGGACLRFASIQCNSTTCSTTCSTTVIIMLAPTTTPIATAICGITIAVKIWVKVQKVLCINNNTSVQLGGTSWLNVPKCASCIIAMPCWNTHCNHSLAVVLQMSGTMATLTRHGQPALPCRRWLVASWLGQVRRSAVCQHSLAAFVMVELRCSVVFVGMVVSGRHATLPPSRWTPFPFRPVHAWLVWCWPACVWSVYGHVAAAAAVWLVRGCRGCLMVGWVRVGSVWRDGVRRTIMLPRTEPRAPRRHPAKSTA